MVTDQVSDSDRRNRDALNVSDDPIFTYPLGYRKQEA